MTSVINRNYDPTMGQFTSVDPMVIATGQPYSYGGGNPVSNIDPMGLSFSGSVMHYAKDVISIPNKIKDSINSSTSSAFHGLFNDFEGNCPFSTSRTMGDAGVAALVVASDASLASGSGGLVSLGDRAAIDIVDQASSIGGAESVRLGQVGESAVRAEFDIGPKVTQIINGRTRIFDGLTSTTVTEVKNVSYQAYTLQLRDSLAYAQQNGLQFDLYVRGGANATTLSAPLQDIIAGDPRFNLKFIP